jgi:hypothetical protein
LTNYNLPRKLTLSTDEATRSLAIRLSDFKDIPIKLKIDVGPSNKWSEVASMQTLDALLNSGHITIDQYLARVPNGVIPKRQELIEEIKQQMMMAQQQQQMIAQQQIPQQIQPV